MEVADVRKMKEQEEENSKLKRMFSNLSLQHEALKDAVAQSTWIDKILDIGKKHK